MLAKDFREFLKEYKIISLAIAFMIGLASQDLVKSLVDNIIMPFISPLVPGTWESAVLIIGTINISWGLFLSALINFLIIALLIFLLAKYVLKEAEKE